MSNTPLRRYFLSFSSSPVDLIACPRSSVVVSLYLFLPDCRCRRQRFGEKFKASKGSFDRESNDRQSPRREKEDSKKERKGGWKYPSNGFAPAHVHVVFNTACKGGQDDGCCVTASGSGRRSKGGASEEGGKELRRLVSLSVSLSLSSYEEGWDIRSIARKSTSPKQGKGQGSAIRWTNHNLFTLSLAGNFVVVIIVFGLLSGEFLG